MQYKNFLYCLKKIVILKVIILFILTSLINAQDKYVKNYTVKDGLPTSIIYCIKRDSNGILWIGHEKGLSRYDGTEWTHFGLKDGLEPAVLAIEFYGGTVWCGTEKGLFRMVQKSDGTKPRFIKIKEYKGLGTVSNFTVWNNRLWVNSSISIYNRNINQKIIVMMISRDFNSFKYKTLIIDTAKMNSYKCVITAFDTTLWVMTDKLFRINKNNPEKVLEIKKFNIITKSPTNNSPFNIEADKNGIIIASGAGLLRFDFNRKESKLLYKNTVVAIKKVGQEYWASVPGLGVIILDRQYNIIDTIRTEEGLANSYIHADMFVDFDGSVWIPTYSGLTHFISTSTSYYFRNNFVKAIQEFNNLLNIGYENKIYAFDKKKIIRYYKTESNYYHLLDDFHVYKKKLWISAGSGIYTIDKKGRMQLKLTKDIFNHPVRFPLRKFIFTQNGYFLIATVRGFAVIPASDDINSKQLRYYLNNKLERLRVVKCFAEDSNVVWVGTNKGLFVLNKGNLQLREFRDKDSILPDLKINDLEIIGKKIYIASSAGIMTLERNKITKLFAKKINTKINTILFYKNYMLLGGEDGVYIIKNKQIIRRLTSQDILPQMYVNKLYIDKYNNLWIATNSGVATVNIKEVISEPSPQKLVISKILRNKKVIFQSFTSDLIKYPHSISLSKYHQKVEIHFASNYIKSAYDVKYEIIVVNGDDTTKFISLKPKFLLDDLEPGENNISISAIFCSGKKTNSIKITIKSPPPFYLTWQFLLIEGLTIIILGLSVSFWHTRIIRKRNIILQEEINRQTKQLQVTNRKLQEKIEEVSELSRVRAVFINFFAHDISNAIGNIRRTLELMRKGFTLDSKIGSSTLEYYLNMSIDRMINIIRKVLMVGRIETKKIEVNYQLTDITHIIREEIEKNKNYLLEKKLTVKLKTSHEKILIHSDINILNEIFENIFNNAVKYSFKNGEILVECNYHTNYSEIKVQDAGPGFPEKDLNRLFRPFTRLGTQPTGGESSIGLGLWIVKSLLNLLHGKIEIKNKAIGALVIIKIPNSQLESITRDFYE